MSAGSPDWPGPPLRKRKTNTGPFLVNEDGGFVVFPGLQLKVPCLAPRGR